MRDVMEAADPADVSNAVEAAEAVAIAVDGAAMKAMPAAMASAVSAAVTSAACDRDAWRERRGNDRRRDGNSNGRFSQHGSVPP
jgi:hypothetical protein